MTISTFILLPTLQGVKKRENKIENFFPFSQICIKIITSLTITMSYAKKPTVSKIECRVCYDAGRSEREYNNHRVKDRNGKTVCPILVNTECRKCKKKGHTIKYCLQVIAKPVQSTEKRIYHSAEHERKVLFPALPQAKTTVVSEAKTKAVSYADKLLREIPKEEPKKQESSLPQGWAVINRMTAEEAAEKREQEDRKRKREDYLNDCFYGRNGRTWIDADSDDESIVEVKQKYAEEYGSEDDDTVYLQDAMDAALDADDEW
jgi:regulator of extracellular matrix RemA (YlzA/DUF370 family)